MENYRTLYRIITEHEYFGEQSDEYLQLRPSSQGSLLMRRRNLLFRQINGNEWAVLYNSEGAGVDTVNDTLEMELSITDPEFVLYTAWENFCPSAAYLLELPLSPKEQEAAVAIRQTDEKRKIGSSFCTVRLHLTEEMLRAAEMGTPELCRLHFRAPNMYWEYIIIPRKDSELPDGNLLIEDVKGIVQFPALTKTTAYRQEAWRSKSTEKIPMRIVYESYLRLMVESNGGARRVLLRQMITPKAGYFQSEEADVLRQVYYV